jgi:hypothetical protein
MLDRYGLAEPEDPSIWRETDDPKMLAMCARLLAKSTTPGTYPSEEKMREALAAGQKLYAITEMPMAEWQLNDPQKNPRHDSLLYRRLMVEIAIRLGEFQTAADIWSQRLRADGVENGAYNSLGLLILPGIYDVVPLLAHGGKESNPFFIPKADAEVMVKEILEALELRAKHGRQWELDETKVGWRELLNRLAEGAFKTHPKEYRDMGVKSAEEILYDPATEEEIEAAEKKVGKLPDDLKEMVRVANGYEFLQSFSSEILCLVWLTGLFSFKGGWHLFGGGIAGIQYIDFADGDAENSWDSNTQEEEEMIDASDIIALETGSDCDSFYHYYMRPKAWTEEGEVTDLKYRYWHWAPWMGGANQYNSVRDYVAVCVEKVEEMLELGEKEDYEGEDESED